MEEQNFGNKEEYSKEYDNSLYTKPKKNEDKSWKVFLTLFVLCFIIVCVKLLVTGYYTYKANNAAKKPEHIALSSNSRKRSQERREERKLRFKRARDLKKENKVFSVLNTEEPPKKGNTVVKTATTIDTKTDTKIEDKPKDNKLSIGIGKYLPLTEKEMIDEVTKDFQKDCDFNLSGLVPIPAPLNPMFVRIHLAQIAVEKDYGAFLEKLCQKDFHPLKEPEKYYGTNSFLILCMVLHAAERDKRKAVDALIKNGADLKIEAKEPKDNNKKLMEAGKTLLHCAAQNGNEDLMKKVLEAGVPVNKPTKSGKTPLYFAVTNNKKDAAKFLIEKGAEVDLNLVLIATDSEMIELLKKEYKEKGEGKRE